MQIRLRYKKEGGHYHCRVFIRHGGDGTFVRSGDLVLDEKDFKAMSETKISFTMIEEGITDAMAIDFREIRVDTI